MEEQGTHKPLVVSSNLTLATTQYTAIMPTRTPMYGGFLLYWHTDISNKPLVFGSQAEHPMLRQIDTRYKLPAVWWDKIFKQGILNRGTDSKKWLD